MMLMWGALLIAQYSNYKLNPNPNVKEVCVGKRGM